MRHSLTLSAPAKLNLFLHILGRRDDGYHDLQTLFQLLDFGDELTFDRREKTGISLQPELPNVPLETNLIYRAARLLQKSTGCTQGADITLTKHLPMGGGIGGGSSDAASTLLALNSLWECGLNLDQLAALGSELGADVPVFVRGRSAFAQGVGEQLQPVELPEKYYLVLTPDCPVSTALIFGHPELTRDTPAITVATSFEQGTRNDCQDLVCKLFPDVAACLDWLSGQSQITSPARMTGTGASVFAPFAERAIAETVLQSSPWQGFVAKGVNLSPAHQQLNQWLSSQE